MTRKHRCPTGGFPEHDEELTQAFREILMRRLLFLSLAGLWLFSPAAAAQLPGLSANH